MARVAIEMPRLGYDMQTGRIAAWLKRPGDPISRGETIAEIETDKTTVEMESIVTGTLLEIVHGPGTDIAVGTPIAWAEDGT